MNTTGATAMHVTVNLLGSPLGWLAAALILIGASEVFAAAGSFVASRLHLSLRSPHVRVRWDRRGALVDMGGGRLGTIMDIYSLDCDPEAPRMAAVHPDDEDWQGPCEWVPLAGLSPVSRQDAA